MARAPDPSEPGSTRPGAARPETGDTQTDRVDATDRSVEPQADDPVEAAPRLSGRDAKKHLDTHYAVVAGLSPSGLTIWQHEGCGGDPLLLDANDSARRIARLDAGSVGKSASELAARFAPFAMLVHLDPACTALEHASHGSFDGLDATGLPVAVEVDTFVLDERSVAVMLRDVTALARAESERTALLAMLDEAEDAERRRLAEALHDDTIQVLAAANIELGALRRRSADPATVRSLEQVEARVRTASRSLRSLVFELYPPDLGSGGLASGIQMLADRLFRERTDVVVDIVDELPAPPHPTTCASVYRVAQEALRNVERHARASAVEVRLRAEADLLVLTVRDDGVGIGVDPDEAAARPGHLGLRSMRERAARHGGTLTIERADPSGTLIELRIPDIGATPGPGPGPNQ
jgi:signal transduction histidine kinase